MCVRQMQSEGLSREEAGERIFMMDIDGLITKSRKNMNPRHAIFAKDLPETKDLFELVKMVRPGALIGASTVRGAFTEDIIRFMAEINPRPIIFALSNPTSKAECTAEEAYKFTNVSCWLCGARIALLFRVPSSSLLAVPSRTSN